MMQAAERGEVSLAGADNSERQLLLRHRNEEIAALARKVFGSPTGGERAREAAH